MKSKPNKNFKKWYKKYKNNKIRNILLFFTPYFKSIFGKFYSIIHLVFMLTSVLCLCFSNNIYHLFIFIIIMSFDFVSNLIYQDCPLTTLEMNYFGNSINKEFKKKMHNLGIHYKCNHIYETQLDCIITTFSMIAIKILTLIFIQSIKTFY
jgi:hypothetical protein